LDGAGLVSTGPFDFKGNLLSCSRRLAKAYAAEPDWTTLANLTDSSAILAAAEAFLEGEVFTKSSSYDALNRLTNSIQPDGSEVKPTYNVAGLLDKIEARIRGAVTWTVFVESIAYNPKGQRERIEYGNGTVTTYVYDPLAFRLIRLKTTRTSDSAVLQNL